MRKIKRVNYLHYGDGLSKITERIIRSDTATNFEEISTLLDRNSSKYLTEILGRYQRKTIFRPEVDEFLSDIEDSNKKKKFFSNLECRGFSYRFYCDMKGFPYRLKKQVNLRVALIADDDLFYPPRVRKYLRRHSANHYFVFDAPAIAFALGRVTRKSWYVLVMQSDICKHGPASVREHFRGWRKILFANIVAEARKSAEYVFLCKSEDVLKSCHPNYPAPTSMPRTWKSIYGGTANDFDMQLVSLPRRVDIQLYDRKRPIYAEKMYRLDLVEKEE